MLKIKIIRAKPDAIEREVNDWLATLGSQPGYKITIINTELHHIGGPDATEAFVITYNIVDVHKQLEQAMNKPAEGAVQPKPPGPKDMGRPEGRPHSTPVTKS